LHRIPHYYVKAGDFSNPVLLEYAKLKEYVDSFKEDLKSPAQQLQELLSKAGIDPAILNHAKPMAIPSQGNKQVSAESLESKEEAFNSPLDNPNLTDEQKYDLLTLKGSKNFSEQEEIWYLNVGTMIQIKRMQNKPVDSSDL
jgi:hypothetical protein